MILQSQDKKNTILDANATVIIFFITIFSIVAIPGYRVFTSDHVYYIPKIQESLGKNGLGDDIITKFDQGKMTYFDEIVILASKIFGNNITIALFVLTIFFRFIFLAGIYRLAFFFSKNKAISIIAAAVLSGGISVFGTQTLTVEILLVPRAAALSIAILSLTFLVEGKIFKASVLTGISFFMHPITTVPFLIIYYGIILDRIMNEKNFASIIFASIPMISILIFFIATPSIVRPEFNAMDQEWFNILVETNNYLFVTTGRIQMILYYAAFSLLFFAGWQWINKTGKKKAAIALLCAIIPLLLFVAAIIFADILKIQIFVQAQLARSATIFELTAVMLFIGYGINYIIKNPDDLITNISIIGIILSVWLKEIMIFAFIPVFTLSFIKENAFQKKWINLDNKTKALLLALSSVAVVVLMFIEKKNPEYLALIFIIAIIILKVATKKHKAFLERNWEKISMATPLALSIMLLPLFSFNSPYEEDQKSSELCTWIQNNTKKEDIFLTDPYASYLNAILRMKCHKGIFVSPGASAQGVFDRKYAFEWKKRMKMAEKAKIDPSEIKRIVKEYGIKYMVLETQNDTGYPIIFQNSKYFVYYLKSKNE
jgi:hypothetical protein